jgi:hypothetical protein
MLKNCRWFVTVRAASAQEHGRLLALLPLLGLLTAAVPATAMPAIVRAQPNHPNPPLCYIDLPGQARQSLDRLCGVGLERASSKLSYYGPDGKLSPAFLAAVKQMRSQRMQFNPQTTAQALREFTAQMPLSAQAQALMNRGAALGEQMSRPQLKSNPAQAQAMFVEAATIHEQLQADPTFVELDKAVRQALVFI